MRALNQTVARLQEEKKAIAEAALGDGSSAAAGPTRLSLQELRTLFGLGRGSRTKAPNPEIFGGLMHQPEELEADAERLVLGS